MPSDITRLTVVFAWKLLTELTMAIGCSNFQCIDDEAIMTKPETDDD
jgi:hypothetical protein